MILEPSCGEAAFLLSAGRRLSTLGARSTRGQLHGSEIHAPSAEQALRLLDSEGFGVDLRLGDFFEREVDPIADAVVGNPPYIRYQHFTGDSRKAAQDAAARAGVRVDGLASSWAPFVVHAAQFLRDDGRLGLVLPSELLHAKYATAVRAFLVSRFKQVTLVTFEERPFDGVLADIVLVLAEGLGPANEIRTVPVKSAHELSGVTSPDALAGWSFPPTDAKWSAALLSEAALAAYEGAIKPTGVFTTLKEWGRVYLGAVSGANDYFCLSSSEALEYGLTREDLLDVAPAGSRHLRGLEYSVAAHAAATASGEKVFLFHADERPNDAAQRYIDLGVSTGVSERYKCRVRMPWHRVPLVSPPDLFLTYMSHRAPRLVTNSAGVHFLNSVHGVALREPVRRLGIDLLPIAALSSVSLLGAELVGRSYGGGVLKLEPREADQLPIPTPQALAKAGESLAAIKPQLSVALRGGRIDEVSRLVDEALLVQSFEMERGAVRAVRVALSEVRGRRLNRSRSAGGR